MEKISEVTIEDKDYPEQLKKICNPPKTLYFRGKLTPNKFCFGIVGTRRCSSYGKQATLEIAGNLAEAGLIIVSGLAPGIDTFSHLACVESKKRTIAVLGTGLDEKSIYPKPNIGLSRKIIETGGCLISEFPPGTPGSKFSFPKRNRIIAGLSLGVLVVEAKQKSGSLITANYAFEEKRKVFAIPGPIFSSDSKGPNDLIKKGRAVLIENANDILEKLNLPILRQNNKTEDGTNEEKLILEILKQGPLDVDKIIEKTKLNTSTISTTLALMEISGKVRNLGGNTYALLR